jgi:hypothetical protein
MAERTIHDRVQTQEEELAALRQEVGRLRAQFTTRRRRTARARLGAALTTALLVALVPLGIFAANFTDLNPGSPHNDNINAIADAGITKGCNPPTNDQYCPNDFVTREQMASFIARTAGLGSNPPVTNAKSVGGYVPDSLIRVARSNGTGVVNATYQTQLTLDITAPGAGFVLVTATGSVYNAQTSGCPCEVRYRLFHLTKVTASPREHYVTVVNNTAGTGGVESNETMAMTYVFPVSAGLNQFQFQAYRYNGSDNLSSDSQMTALFVPFGATGGATISEGDDSPSLPTSKP